LILSEAENFFLAGGEKSKVTRTIASTWELKDEKHMRFAPSTIEGIANRKTGNRD
jgi:hypothetical protein